MKIGALGLGTPFSKHKGDCGWYLYWHHPLDVTWRWSFDVDYWWRKYGFNGERPPHVRKWKWSYLKPGAYQTMFYPYPRIDSWDTRLKFSPYGGFGWQWLGISISYHYQPKWDRNFDAEAIRRADRDDTYRMNVQRAMQERESQQRLN